MSQRQKFLIVTCVALVAAILIPVIHHYQLRTAVNAYIAELKARGEPMKLAHVIPPPIPPEQNGADTFRNAAALIDADKSLLETNSYSAMKMVAPGKAMICWQQSDARGYDATNSWEEVTAAVAQNGEAFALLQQIIEKPSFDFQIEYRRGIDDLNFTNLFLAESKRAALRLEAAALCDLHRGDTGSAVKNLRTMLALVKATRDERLIISELVRMAIAQIALTVSWEILQSPNPTDEQLAVLQRDWTNLEFIRSNENALAMERATGEITLAKWRGSHAELQNYFDRIEEVVGQNEANTVLDKIKIRTKVILWRHWWSYPDEARTLKGYQVLLETARSVQTNYSFLTAQQQQESKLHEFITTNGDEMVWFGNPKEMNMHFMLSSSVRSLSRVFDKVMKIEVAKQLTVAAIVLKRYQLKYGNYPADLKSLVPEFILTIPLDPVDSQPLRYQRQADGTFLLYSIGENGKDDGGDPSLDKSVESPSFQWQNPHALDWVWPQPATSEEIQKYYNEQARKSK